MKRANRSDEDRAVVFDPALDKRLREHYRELADDGWRHAARERLWRRVAAVQRTPTQSPANRPRRLSRSRSLVVALALCLVSVGIVVAASTLTNLGKPTSNVSPLDAFPLDGFHHAGAPLRNNFRLELLFIGTLADQPSALERWPLVKALDQFGTLSGVRPLMPACPKAAGGGPQPSLFCPLATFDWSHATYHSRYVSFVHRDLLDTKGHLFQRLSPAELRIFHRYAAHGRNYRDAVGKSVVFGTPTSTRVLPIVLVGGYVQTISQILTPNDLSSLPAAQQTTYNIPLPFDTIRSMLLSGKDSGSSRTVEDINAAANIVTALICHGDGLQPHNVCHRAAVRQILKHV